MVCDRVRVHVILATSLILISAFGWTGEVSLRSEPQAVNLFGVKPGGTAGPVHLPQVRRPEGNQESSRVPIFSEDFQGGVMPAGWTVIDNDGLPVHGNVPQFTEAWIVALDFDDATETDYVAQSTSWYNPPGTSDDWMITPAISIGTSNQLSWRAEAQDVNYPDGYKVYVSTTGPTIAGCQANPPLFSIAAENGAVWTEREASLGAYAGQSVYICFQNDSTDKFILMIDDVVVDVLENYDAAVSSAELVSEYGRVPVAHSYAMAIGATVTNEGGMDVTNVVLTARVLIDGVPVHTVVGPPVPTLGPGASHSIDLPDYTPLNVGLASVEYTVSIDELDGDPSNNTALAPVDLLVTAAELGRDDGIDTATLGIGEGTAGELGTQFSIGQTALLGAATFLVGPFTPPVGPSDPDIVGDNISVNVRQMAAGVPDAILGTSEVYTFVDYDQHLLTLNFDPPVVLPVGEFMLGVMEEDSNIKMGTSQNIFTPGTGWVIFGPNPWLNNEDYGFNVTYILRAVFADPILTVSKTGSGTGTVTSSPIGIDCGGDCVEAFALGTVVDLTATPDGSFGFIGWEGDADCLDGQVTVNRPIACTAVFEMPIFNDGFESSDVSAWDDSNP